MSGIPGGTGAGENGADANAPRVQIVAQYVKDLSFENPGAPSQMAQRPNIELSVDLPEPSAKTRAVHALSRTVDRGSAFRGSALREEFVELVDRHLHAAGLRAL